jgi:heme/copper-type cytochrome/quinol oxidase subunit 4
MAEKLVYFTNFNPVFKGVGTIIVGLLALLFALYMRNRRKEQATLSNNLFLGLSIFVIVYGLFILIFRPAWWVLPY